MVIVLADYSIKLLARTKRHKNATKRDKTRSRNARRTIQYLQSSKEHLHAASYPPLEMIAIARYITVRRKEAVPQCLSLEHQRLSHYHSFPLLQPVSRMLPGHHGFHPLH